ncbi:flagellar hook-length control protein FliK [Metabacillus indicus]|uniref:flagellar hook-length control protein FliK n=1 Tax=Metabacillus indicus TaxID=246786 RepID=UPI00317099E6
MKITFPAGPVSLMNNDGKAGSGVQASFLSLLLGSAGAAGSTETEGQSDIFDEKTENADPELEAAFKELIKELGINEALMPEGSEYGLPPLPLAAEQTISKQTKTGLGRFLKTETETAAEQAVYTEITWVKNGAGEISAPESEAGFSGRVAPNLQAKTGAISENMTNAHASPEAQLQQTKKTDEVKMPQNTVEIAAEKQTDFINENTSQQDMPAASMQVDDIPIKGDEAPGTLTPGMRMAVSEKYTSRNDLKSEVESIPSDSKDLHTRPIKVQEAAGQLNRGFKTAETEKPNFPASADVHKTNSEASTGVLEYVREKPDLAEHEASGILNPDLKTLGSGKYITKSEKEPDGVSINAGFQDMGERPDKTQEPDSTLNRGFVAAEKGERNFPFLMEGDSKTDTESIPPREDLLEIPKETQETDRMLDKGMKAVDTEKVEIQFPIKNTQMADAVGVSSNPRQLTREKSERTEDFRRLYAEVPYADEQSNFDAVKTKLPMSPSEMTELELSTVQNQPKQEKLFPAHEPVKISEPQTDLMQNLKDAKIVVRNVSMLEAFRTDSMQNPSAGTGPLLSESFKDETFERTIQSAIKEAVDTVLKSGQSERDVQSNENIGVYSVLDRTVFDRSALDKLTAILKPLHRIFSSGGEQGLARLIEGTLAAVRTDSDMMISSLKNLQTQLEESQILPVLQKAGYKEQPVMGHLPLKKEIVESGGKQEAVHQLLNKGFFRPAAAESSNGNRPQVPESIGDFQADFKQLEVNVTENHMRSPGLQEMKNEWQQLFSKDGNGTVHQSSTGLTEIRLNTAPELKENQEEPVKREFSGQLTEIFKRAKPAFALNGFSQMTIRLAPEHLGLLTVKLQRLNGETTAKIITSTSSAKELVEQSIQHLKAALPAFQIAVDRFDVYGEQPDSFRERHQDERQPEKEQGEEKDRAEEPDSFKDHLNMLT